MKNDLLKLVRWFCRHLTFNDLASVVKEHTPADSQHHCAYLPSEDDYARRLQLTTSSTAPSFSVILERTRALCPFVTRHRPPLPVSSVFIELLTEAKKATSD